MRPRRSHTYIEPAEHVLARSALAFVIKTVADVIEVLLITAKTFLSLEPATPS